MQREKPPYFHIRGLIMCIEEPNRSICKRVLDENWERFCQAPGSTHNHQAWPGGYIDHITEACNLAHVIYPAIAAAYDPGFTLGDLVLCIFLHDFEKPWKYVLGEDELRDVDLSTKEKRHEFRRNLIERYGFQLTDEHWNGIEFAEGEIHQYSNRHRHMGRLAAYVHTCDVLSARARHDSPMPNGTDPWTGAWRFR